MTSPKDVTSIVRENLHLVFGEADPEKRLAELSRLWVPSSKSLFIDPLGLFRGHEAINNLISSLHAQYPGMAFTELGKHIHIPWQDLNIFCRWLPCFLVNCSLHWITLWKRPSSDLVSEWRWGLPCCKATVGIWSSRKRPRDYRRRCRNSSGRKDGETVHLSQWVKRKGR